MSHSSCSAYSYCNYSSYLGNNRKKGHHPRCECGYRFNCFTANPYEYCKIDKYKCTKCCIASMHKTKQCSECKKLIGVSCYDVCFDMIGTVCKDCNKCTNCGIPFYLTEEGYEFYPGICEICYKDNDRQVKCGKKKCKRYVTINLLIHDENDTFYCDHPQCKK
jgi:hypothetical protein